MNVQYKYSVCFVIDDALIVKVLSGLMHTVGPTCILVIQYCMENEKHLNCDLFHLRPGHIFDPSCWIRVNDLCYVMSHTQCVTTQQIKWNEIKWNNLIKSNVIQWASGKTALFENDTSNLRGGN